MDVAKGKVGPELEYDVKVEGGKVKVEAKYDGAQADVALAVSIDSDLLLDKLAAKIPGQIDDAVIGVIKAALKAV